jgi:hypothetical protein
MKQAIWSASSRGSNPRSILRRKILHETLQREIMGLLCSTKMHVYEVIPRKNYRGVDLISDALPFSRLWYSEPNAVSSAVDYAKFFSRSNRRKAGS